jgi:short-subunit dehydrogenase
MNMKDTTAVVVGATGGIGQAIVRQLACSGASLVLVARRRQPLLSVAARLADRGARADVIIGDLAENAPAIARQAIAIAGQVDLLVNCAGTQTFGYSHAESASDTDRAFAVNVIGPIQLINSLLPSMLSKGRGKIVNVGSIFGSIGYPCFASYSATKFALRGYSEALRRELAGSGIAVHYVAPRYTRTAFNGDAVARMATALKMGQDVPERVAREVVRAIEQDRGNFYVGWPETFFVKVNALFPRLVDSSLKRKLKVIEAFALEAANRSS